MWMLRLVLAWCSRSLHAVLPSSRPQAQVAALGKVSPFIENELGNAHGSQSQGLGEPFKASPGTFPLVASGHLLGLVLLTLGAHRVLQSLLVSP